MSMRRFNDRSCFFLQASRMMKWKSSPFSLLSVIRRGGVIPQWSQPPCWTTLQADMDIWTALHRHPTGPLVLQLVARMMTTSVALLHVHSPVWHWRGTNARFRTVQSNKNSTYNILGIQALSGFSHDSNKHQDGKPLFKQNHQLCWGQFH